MDKILATLFLSVITIITYGQKKTFDAGIFIGFNGVHIEGQNEVLYNSTNGTIWGSGGITTGLSVKREVSKSFYWKFDLRYIRKGSVYEFTNTQGTQDFEAIKFDYAELPLLTGYKIKLSKHFIYFEAGCAIAKLLNSEKLVSDYSYGQDISLFSKFKDYDYSLLGSIKISANKREKVLLGLRVAHSFISIHKAYKLYNFDYGIEICYQF